MSLLKEGSPETGESPLTEAAAATETSAATVTLQETDKATDLEELMTEALEIEKIMTAVRLHRQEYEDPAVKDAPEWHLAIHKQALDAHIGQLAAYGVSESDVPSASLRH